MRPETRPPPEAARPLVQVVIAVLAGSLLAAIVPGVVSPAGLALAATAGAWFARRDLLERRAGRPVGGAPTRSGDRPSVETGGPPAVGRTGRLALVAVLLLAAIRAGPPETPEAPGAPGPAEPQGPGSGDGPGTGSPRAPAPPGGALEGVWRAQPGSDGFDRGRLGDTVPPFRVPRGTVADGERVRILPGRPSRETARGTATPGGAPGPGLRPVWPDEVVRLAGRGQPAGPLAAARSWALGRTRRFGDPVSRGLARALVCGDTGDLDPALSDLFVRTGLRHLLAVSGMHVAWVAVLFAAPLGWLAARLAALAWRAGAEWRTAVRAAVSAGCVLAYAELAGGAAPARRAAIAAALIFVAPLVPLGPPGQRGLGAARPPGEDRGRGRRVDFATLWSLALLLECLADPAAVRRTGVQLSYAATLGLLLATRPIAGHLARGLALLGLRTGPRARAGLAARVSVPRLVARCVARLLLWATAASAAAVLGTLPIVWERFGECSPVGVLATPLVAPWIALLLGLGWCVVLGGGLLPGALFALPARGLAAVLERVDALPATPIPLPARPQAAVVSAVVLTLLALRRGSGGSRRALGPAAALAWAVLLLPWTPAPRGLEVQALDVGHGTAVVLRAPGVGCWIFDAGSRDRVRVARGALAPLLAQWEVVRPGVVLSHGDADHSGALGWLVERYTPHTWAGALPAPLVERLPHTVRRVDLDAGSVRLAATPALAPRPALGLDLLRGRPGEDNEGSRSLAVGLGSSWLLFCGDAEGEGLGDLLRAGRVPAPCRLLLAPHHGSQTPWLGRLLEASRAREVWISASHRPPVAAELTRRGLAWRCTASRGPLTLDLLPGVRESPVSGVALAWSSLDEPP